MPVYEGLGSDKNSVVFEFGSAYTKCGFTSEPSPRAIIPTKIYLDSIKKTIKIFDLQQQNDYSSKNNNLLLLEQVLEKFIKKIYFQYLAVNPKDRRVIIVETIFFNKILRNLLAKLLFKRFDIPSLLFVPNHLVVLSTLGLNTALVLDIGYLEAIAIPIYEGITNLDSIQFAPLGSKSIHLRLMDELIQRKASFKINEQITELKSEHLKEWILEDLKFKCCFVTNFERGSYLAQQKLINNDDPDDPDDQDDQELKKSLNESILKNLKIKKSPPSIIYPFDGNKILTIPGSLRESVCEVLFEMYGEEHTLPTLIIESIRKSPKDCRKQLASNIILIGGTSMLPGLKYRLLKEIENLLLKNNERYKNDLFLTLEDFRFHRLPCKENYASWLGASIFSTTDLLAMRSTTSEQYFKQMEQMKDWTNFDFFKN